MTKRYVITVKTPQGTKCYICDKEITVDQTRYGQARESMDGGEFKHGRCQPPPQPTEKKK